MKSEIVSGCKGLKALLLSFMILLLAVVPVMAGEKYGTFVKVIENATGSFDDISKDVQSGLEKAGWEVLGTYDSGVPQGCTFRSRVIVFSSKDYAASILSNGVKSAFALPLRAGVYEDETGIHVAVVNPASVNRTIIDETKLDDFSATAAKNIVDAISSAAPGTAVNRQIGELRTKGRISGMGGGDFTDKIEEIYIAKDDTDPTMKQLVEGVRKGILGNTKGWKLTYLYNLSDHNVIIFGVTNTMMERRAFTIAGEKRSSGSYKFPGLDHGASFPIEVIVYKDNGKWKVVTLDGMYRMKMYFEDAGMWAFMKNMSMPGEIENEITQMSVSELTK
jgi:uncharacterized protein (DUF302 family)